MFNATLPTQHSFSAKRNRLSTYTPIKAIPRFYGKTVQFTPSNGYPEGSLQSLANELSSLKSNLRTDAEKRLCADKFAKKLFIQHGSQNELLAFANLMGVKVLDDKDVPWVGTVLKKYGAGAAFDCPESLLGVSVDPRYRYKMPGMPPEYEAAYKEADEKKYPLMFISSKKPSFLIRFLMGQDATLNMLRHETYHLIQHKVGLTFTANNPKTRFKAEQVRCELFNGLGQLNSFTPAGMYQGIKTFIQFKSDVIKINLMTLWGRPQFQNSSTQETVGKALRCFFDREREDYQFFIQNKNELNIEPKFVQFNEKSIKFYDQLEQYSHKFDSIEN